MPQDGMIVVDLALQPSRVLQALAEPHLKLHSRPQFAVIDRLHQIIVGADGERLDLLLGTGASRNHDDLRRSLGGRLQTPASFMATKPGHFNV